MSTAEHVPFSLAPSQVPLFPASNASVDVLRWTVAVMDSDDDDIGFAASLLSHAHKHGALTEKQDKYAKRTVSRVRALWAAGQLRCQQSADGSPLRLVSGGTPA